MICTDSKSEPKNCFCKKKKNTFYDVVSHIA